MRYITLPEVLELHRQIMERSGSAIAILSVEALESAPAQPRMTFGGQELYPTIHGCRCCYLRALIRCLNRCCGVEVSGRPPSLNHR